MLSIQTVHIKVTVKVLDDLIAKSNFQVVALIDSNNQGAFDCDGND